MTLLNTDQIKTTVAEAIMLRTITKDDSEAATLGAVKTCMTAVAGAFVGFNGDDDAMRGIIGEAWLMYAVGRGLTKKDGTPYETVKDAPAPTISDYLVFAKAGVRNVFAQADVVASAATGKWYVNARDLLRAHFNDGAALNAATMELIEARREAKKNDTNRAIEAQVKALKRLAKDHGLDTTSAQKSLEALKTTTPVAAQPATAPANNVTVLTPKPTPIPQVPAPQPVPQVAGAPTDVFALLGQLAQMPQFQQAVAAYVPAPAQPAPVATPPKKNKK